MSERAEQGPPETGIRDVDDEHRLQYQLLDALEEALRTSDVAKARALARQLFDFSEAHFGSEQVLMRFYSYPGYQSHEREHGELLRELQRMLAQVELGDPVSLADTPAQLRQWLTVHVQTADRAFGAFAQRSGLPQEA